MVVQALSWTQPRQGSGRERAAAKGGVSTIAGPSASSVSRLCPVPSHAAYARAGTVALLAPHLASETGLLLADGTTPAPVGVEGFGRCLFQAPEGLLQRGHAAACLLSSDMPTLPIRVMTASVRILLQPGERGVFGACDDGGYYLIGLKRAHARLFAWSTDSVAQSTRIRA